MITRILGKRGLTLWIQRKFQSKKNLGGQARTRFAKSHYFAIFFIFAGFWIVGFVFFALDFFLASDRVHTAFSPSIISQNRSPGANIFHYFSLFPTFACFGLVVFVFSALVPLNFCLASVSKRIMMGKTSIGPSLSVMKIFFKTRRKKKDRRKG